MHEDYMHGFISRICKDIGPRESGTKAEEQAGDAIEEEMKKFCDETHQEEYISSPTAFLGFIRYGAMLLIGAIVLYWLSLLKDLGMLQITQELNLVFLFIAAGITIFTAIYFIAEVMIYYEIVDFMFPKKKSKNIVGIINPTGEVKHTILFAGHHDSAYEFNTFYYLKTLGALTIFLGFIGAIILSIVIVLKLIFSFLSIDLTIVFMVFGIFFLCLLPIAVIYIFFHSYKPVPGAFDNLSAVSVALGIGKYLAENKKNLEIYPKHTRVYLISFAGEEAGLRGAKRYVQSHYKQIKDSGALFVNMDGIGEQDNVIIAKNELLIGARHNKQMVEKLFEIAQNAKIGAVIGTLPFGATDAAAFSKKHLPATVIMAYPHKLSLPKYYHTRLDTPDVVEKEALGQALQICTEYLKYLDKME
jgi:aminopeptidase YwaD